MWFFTKEKIIYVDSIQDFRSQQIWEYKLFDRVWVVDTVESAFPRHPWSGRDHLEIIPFEALILNTELIRQIPRDTQQDFISFGKWTMYHPNWWTDKVWYETEVYSVITREWKIVKAYTVKPSHGEFQEEFDHMQALEHQKIELEKARARFAETLEWLEEELTKWKTLQNTMVDRLIWATFTTKNKS